MFMINQLLSYRKIVVGITFLNIYIYLYAMDTNFYNLKNILYDKREHSKHLNRILINVFC